MPRLWKGKENAFQSVVHNMLCWSVWQQTGGLWMDKGSKKIKVCPYTSDKQINCSYLFEKQPLSLALKISCIWLQRKSKLAALHKLSLPSLWQDNACFFGVRNAEQHCWALWGTQLHRIMETATSPYEIWSVCKCRGIVQLLSCLWFGTMLQIIKLMSVCSGGAA